MDAQMWEQRWAEGRIGFHQQTVTPQLEQHWPGLGVPAGARVFVPLAGKSLDMVWLVEHGHPVLGVELSQLAIDQFFAERGLQPDVHESAYGVHHVAGHYELIRGDVFDLDLAGLGGCTAVFDRASLIALPAEDRPRYARLFDHLAPGTRGLVVTLDYDQSRMDGPPFSVPEPEVDRLYAPAWQVDRLERSVSEPEPRLARAGLTELATTTYALTHH
ncbi:thiopurine S-methyltransferase [Barrientosiimonas endolithica]|uniref:Thiopurine S-methyltransferase n=1 Tax=Barrientosiimonas endolithica TaxID=1535208 RepID=A0ABM8H6G7_9MICO|nr:thiopurine S-methyltransferase [Barrientosiimonas endolithica]BDZ56426.1 thiopurine S-methyltransferase [Barrientosiimonas endolithica]